MRVYQIARELDRPHRGMLQLMRELGYDVPSHMARIDDEQETMIREAVERHPGSVELLGTLLGAQMQRGDREGALGSAERLLRLQPADPQIQQVVRDLRARMPGGR